jgi:hypothetical protein
MLASPRHTRWLASAYATAGLVFLPTLHWAATEYGPPHRVVFRDYLLPFDFCFIMLAGALVGVSIGADAPHLLRRSPRGHSVIRLAIGCVLGAGFALIPAALAALVLVARQHEQSQ